MHKIRNKRILVIGAGAIGGIITGFLARSGYNVQLVTKYHDLADRISNSGIHISGINGDFTFAVPSVPTVKEAEGPFDYVFLSTKAYDMEQPALAALPKLAKNGRIIILQNGIVEEEIEKIIGREKTIGCIVGWGATLLEPGSMQMTSQGEFLIGGMNGQSRDELQELQELLNRVERTYVVDNISEHIYSKLVINMCVTTMGAISGYNVGQMLNRRKFRLLIIQIIREAIEVASAMDMTVPKYAGKLDYYKIIKRGNLFKTLVKHFVMQAFSWKYRKLKSSGLQSLERGKPTEINYLNGYVSNKGKEYNVPTPLNDLLIKYVNEIELGKRTITPNNFYNREFKAFYPSIFSGNQT